MPEDEQDKGQDYERVLDGLLVGVDMADDVSRKMAYNACLAYAQDELGGDPRVNLFMALASERLGQVRVHFGVVKGMVPLPENACLHLRYAAEAGPVLTGNADGLRYLSDLCAALAAAPLPGEGRVEEHVHLYSGEPPMSGQGYGLTIYHSADDWFDRPGPDPEGGPEGEPAPAPPPREIDPDAITAIEFFEDAKTPLPPPLFLRYDKLYRVLKRRPHTPEDEVWEKPLPNSDGSRMWVFTIRDDAKEVFEIALHLDDAGIHYFTRSDLEQIREVEDW